MIDCPSTDTSDTSSNFVGSWLIDDISSNFVGSWMIDDIFSNFVGTRMIDDIFSNFVGSWMIDDVYSNFVGASFTGGPLLKRVWVYGLLLAPLLTVWVYGGQLVQGLFVPFARVGSSDPVRVLRLFHNKYSG